MIDHPPAPELPSQVAEPLARYVRQLTDTLGDRLVSLVLYGGLARGRYRPGVSDVNVAVVLRDVTAAALEDAAPILRAAWREIRVEPLILAASEVPGAARAFSTKMLDIQKHHIVLAGQDIFHGLRVDPEEVRFRMEQELRNLAMRLRRRFVALYGDPISLAEVLFESAVALRANLLAMLDLAGAPPPADETSAQVFAAAAPRFGLDADALRRLGELRAIRSADGQGPPAMPEDVVGLYGRIMAAADAAADAAASLKAEG
jgi:predicted nucleotidyltransferase